MICEHGYVPHRFGTGITVPVVKDRLGDLSCASNYKPITLSPIISKKFEYCILHKSEHLLQSDDLQLGFKKNSSCPHALFVLTATIEHFITHGSKVHASLNATKAFDRVHHVKLFQKLIYKGFPGGIIKILVDWYGKTFSIVKWNNSYSSSYSIKTGIRQGVILSPFFI